MGGQETSATALVWTLYELSLNAEVEVKLLNEIMNVTSGEQIDFSRIRELKLFEEGDPGVDAVTPTLLV